MKKRIAMSLLGIMLFQNALFMNTALAEEITNHSGISSNAENILDTPEWERIKTNPIISEALNEINADPDFAEVVQGSNTNLNPSTSQNDSVKKINVSNFEELKAALTTTELLEVNIIADITLDGNIYIPVTGKVVMGNGHKLDMNSHDIKLDIENGEAEINDLSIEKTNIFGFFWSDKKSVRVTYNNIHVTGNQMTYLPYGELILEGDCFSVAYLEEVYQGNKLTITPNANVTMISFGILTSCIDLFGEGAELNVAKDGNLSAYGINKGLQGGSKLKLTNEGFLKLRGRLNVALHIDDQSTAEFLDGSEFIGISYGTVEEGAEATNGKIIVRSGASFDVTSSGNQGTVITGDELTFEEGSRFSMTNLNEQGKGAVMGSWLSKTKVNIKSSTGIRTWERGSDPTGEPTNSYEGSLEASFSLDGYENTVKQENMTCNNQDFANNYSTGDVSKIVGGY